MTDCLSRYEFFYMKYFICGLVFLFQFSCSSATDHKTVNILINEIVNENFVQEIDQAEKVLLESYLYAYGNECDGSTSKVKCKILALLGVKDECADQHLDFLEKWFKKDVIMSSKLQNCPVLPAKFAIQNKFKKITIEREADTIRISYILWGVNESQEKSWNIDQTDAYLLNENELTKIF